MCSCVIYGWNSSGTDTCKMTIGKMENIRLNFEAFSVHMLDVEGITATEFNGKTIIIRIFNPLSFVSNVKWCIYTHFDGQCVRDVTNSSTDI